MMARAEPERPQAGVATIWAVFAVLLLGQLGGVAAVLAVTVARAHQLDAVADLAAIAAAERRQQGADPRQAAARVATANGTVLLACRIVGPDVLVRVGTTLALPFGLRPEITGSARAGP